jgi:hypothetical protein
MLKDPKAVNYGRRKKMQVKTLARQKAMPWVFQKIRGNVRGEWFLQ